MDSIDKAVAAWHRVYAQLSAARERVVHAARDEAGLDELKREVQRLEAREQRALRAVRDALISARQRRVRAPDRPSWADTEPA